MSRFPFQSVLLISYASKVAAMCYCRSRRHEHYFPHGLEIGASPSSFRIVAAVLRRCLASGRVRSTIVRVFPVVSSKHEEVKCRRNRKEGTRTDDDDDNDDQAKQKECEDDAANEREEGDDVNRERILGDLACRFVIWHACMTVRSLATIVFFFLVRSPDTRFIGRRETMYARDMFGP